MLTVTSVPTDGVLLAPDGHVVNGTDDDDVVITQDAQNANTFEVEITTNGTKTTTTVTDVTGRVIANGSGGNDTITLNASRAGELHGGTGNDTITGGSGDDVIWGDDGDDVITGAAGNDVLIGGNGNDRLVGSAGNDLLIAGDLTNKDWVGQPDQAYDYASLRAISDAWALQFAQDVDLGNNSDKDVVDVGTDQLTGSAGADWFIVSSGDKITDLAKDPLKEGDKITTIDEPSPATPRPCDSRAAGAASFRVGRSDRSRGGGRSGPGASLLVIFNGMRLLGSTGSSRR